MNTNYKIFLIRNNNYLSSINFDTKLKWLCTNYFTQDKSLFVAELFKHCSDFSNICIAKLLCWFKKYFYLQRKFCARFFKKIMWWFNQSLTFDYVYNMNF